MLAVKYLPKESKLQRVFYKCLNAGPLTSCVWFNRRYVQFVSNVNVLVFLMVYVYSHRYVHFLSTAHIPYLGDRSLPEIMRKDRRKKVSLPCPTLHWDGQGYKCR